MLAAHVKLASIPWHQHKHQVSSIAHTRSWNSRGPEHLQTQEMFDPVTRLACAHLAAFAAAGPRRHAVCYCCADSRDLCSSCRPPASADARVRSAIVECWMLAATQQTESGSLSGCSRLVHSGNRGCKVAPRRRLPAGRCCLSAHPVVTHAFAAALPAGPAAARCAQGAWRSV